MSQFILGWLSATFGYVMGDVIATRINYYLYKRRFKKAFNAEKDQPYHIIKSSN